MPAAARVTDTHSGICDHGEKCCPHSVTGTITDGSTDVEINGLKAARKGDPVEHNCPHCGTGNISSCSSTVFHNGISARKGDSVTYPGGGGVITSGSSDVDIGG